MLLEGSCRCGAVRFRVESPEPYPFMLCYCSICRKTAGGGGYAINLGALTDTLEVEGEESISVYRATIDGEQSPAQRRFCRSCGSALWVYDPRWPELVHPFASAVDTPLPAPPRSTHIMLASKAPWAEPQFKRGDKRFDGYPDESIAEWHERQELTREGE